MKEKYLICNKGVKGLVRGLSQNMDILANNFQTLHYNLQKFGQKFQQMCPHFSEWMGCLGKILIRK